MAANYEGRLKSQWTGGSSPLLCCYVSRLITAARCRQSTNFSNGPCIRMDVMEIGWKIVDWIHLAQDRDQWWDLLNTVMNLQFP
jgi:hypothetical protein